MSATHVQVVANDGYDRSPSGTYRCSINRGKASHHGLRDEHGFSTGMAKSFQREAHGAIRLVAIRMRRLVIPEPGISRRILQFQGVAD